MSDSTKCIPRGVSRAAESPPPRNLSGTPLCITEKTLLKQLFGNIILNEPVLKGGKTDSEPFERMIIYDSCVSVHFISVTVNIQPLIFDINL